MKIVHTPRQPERKVVAIIGCGTNPGYYTRDKNEKVWWVGSDGELSQRLSPSWKYLLDSSRTKVYEGDSITITF